MDFSRLRAVMKKYVDVLTFGATVGVSGYLCATGVMTQCVSLVAVVTNAVN